MQGRYRKEKNYG